MSTDKNIDEQRLSEEQKLSCTAYAGEERNSKICGFGNQPMKIPAPTFLRAKSEAVFPSEGNEINANIVITRDRPNSIFSGYGGKGHQKCGTIDLVAGRISSLCTTTILNAENEPEPALVDPNFEHDAARIYISEKTDIDENFNLVDAPEVHEAVGRSAVGIKADAVRIIGNEGVKIVTGVYEKNSRGGDATPAGIALIAMNDAEEKTVFEVEPFAKGKKLEACIYSLQEQVYKLNSILTDFIEAQEVMNNLFLKHTHHNGVAFTTTPSLNAFDPLVQEHKKQSKVIEKALINLDKNLENMLRWEMVYLSPESKDYILSLFNGTN